MMAAEIMMARQLTYFAARQKDSGRRCDLEAGMAKLLAARVAWAAADNAVQIHGGNGFALEFPVSRLLCDARILSIFEGAAEIQAQVIARRLLDREQLNRAPKALAQAIDIAQGADPRFSQHVPGGGCMTKLKIHQGDWVLVCDGKKALLLENVGDEKFLNLKTKRGLRT